MDEQQQHIDKLREASYAVGVWRLFNAICDHFEDEVKTHPSFFGELEKVREQVLAQWK